MFPFSAAVSLSFFDWAASESQGRNIWDKRRLLVVLFLILVDASCIFPLRVHLVLCSSLKDELKVKPLDSWPVDSLGLASDGDVSFLSGIIILELCWKR